MTGLDHFLKRTAMALLFAVPFVPLIVSSSMFFPFITGKGFAFRILVVLMTLAWFVLAIRVPTYRPKWQTPVFVALLLFVSALGLSNILGENPYSSFWSNFERMEGYILILHAFAYFIVASSLLTTKKLFGYLAGTSLVVSVLVSIYAFVQIYGALVINQGGVRVDATFGNATYLAIYMAFHIFVALVLSVSTRYRTTKVLLGILALAQVVILYKTATRGAMLGLLGGALVAAVVALIKGRGTLQKAATGVLVGVFLIVGGFLAIKNTDFVRESPVLNRFASISLTETTTESRFILWGMAFDGWKEHPLLGWGQENFNLVFNEYYVPKLYRQEAWFDRAHNIYVEWFVAGGLVGGLSYLSLLGTAVYVLWWKRRGDEDDYVLPRLLPLEAALLSGALAAYAINNFFVFDNLVSYVMFFTLLAYLHVGRIREQREVVRASHLQTASGMSMAGVVLATIAAIFILYSVNLKPILASRALIRAINPAGGNINVSVEEFRRVFSYETFATTEAREQLVQMATRVRNEPNIPAEAKGEILTMAEEEMLAQVEETPNDARYRIFMGNYYLTLGRNDDAIRELKTAVSLSPGKQQMYYSLAAAHANNGDSKEALSVMKTAFELETTNREALYAYIASAIFADETKLAAELIDTYHEGKMPTDNRVLSAFVQRKNYEGVVAVWQARVLVNPEDGQGYTSLAAAYLMNGNREKAIEAIKEAIRLEPAFEEQGNHFINEIRAGRNPVGQ